MIFSLLVIYISFKGILVDEFYKNYISKLESYIRYFSVLFFGVLCCYSVIDIIECICKKAGLESIIAKLEFSLKQDVSVVSDCKMNHRL